uniref:SyrB-like regulator n=1 Tax=Ensifer adhaerens TaxID=106592 RepID=UPI003F49ACE3
MADEVKTDNSTAVADTATVAEVAPAKKQRRSRQQNVALEATAETSEAIAARSVRERPKRTENAPDEKAAGKPQGVAKAKGKRAAKTTGKTQTIKPSVEAPVPGLDEIADLLQLEKENARLRKALAEKLRAENADLRKRLGLV